MLRRHAALSNIRRLIRVAVRARRSSRSICRPALPPPAPSARQTLCAVRLISSPSATASRIAVARSPNPPSSGATQVHDSSSQPPARPAGVNNFDMHSLNCRQSQPQITGFRLSLRPAHRHHPPGLPLSPPAPAGQIHSSPSSGGSGGAFLPPSGGVEWCLSPSPLEGLGSVPPPSLRSSGQAVAPLRASASGILPKAMSHPPPPYRDTRKATGDTSYSLTRSSVRMSCPSPPRPRPTDPPNTLKPNDICETSPCSILSTKPAALPGGSIHLQPVPVLIQRSVPAVVRPKHMIRARDSTARTSSFSDSRNAPGAIFSEAPHHHRACQRPPHSRQSS